MKLLRKPVSGVMLTLLLIGMLALSFNIQPVKASGTVYIRADGSIDPSDAPISSVDNVTYTLTGNITSDADGIVVERSNIIIDGADYTVEGSRTYPYMGIYLSGVNNATIANVNVTYFHYGIYLNYSSNNNISGNNITNNEYGIRLYYSSSYNSISGNNITDNNWGIYLDYSSSYNSISGNNITANNGFGIWLDSSSNNSISGNNITANYDGIYLCSSLGNSISGNTFTDNGLMVSDSYQNSVENNTVNSKPLVYLEDVADYTIGDAGQVILVRCENMRVEGLNLSRTAVGIYIWETSSSTISGNNITANNWGGILLESSFNNSVSGNKITANSVNGIWLHYYSNYNSICGNTITDNLWGIVLDSFYNYNSISGNNIIGNNITDNNAGGIGLAATCNNSIVGNTFTNDGLMVSDSYQNSVENNTVNGKPLVYLEGVADYSVGDAGQVILVSCISMTVENLSLSNTDVGIQLWNTTNTEISGNNIASNVYGITLGHSNYNIISGNNITDNNGYGVGLAYSSNNIIYHNNIDNTEQVYSYVSTNVWDDGYPSGGNYWSNYTDVDLYYGPYQNQTGSDDIWDHPFIINENNTDRYSLVNPWSHSLSRVQGLDVSHYQGDINWTKVYGAGYRFAFVKATGGVSFRDPNFTANMEQASEAGLIVGAYYFAYPEYNDAVSEAQHFLSVAGDYMKIGYLRPVLDLEDDPKEDSYPYRMGKDNLSNWIHTWMNTVKNETGIEPIIYTGWYARVGDYLNDSIAEYDLWIADWTYDPAISPDTGIWESWDFWQYSNKGAIPGIAGDVDLDLFNGYMQKLYDAFTISNVKVFNVVWENRTYPITVYSNSTVTHLVFNQPQTQISLNITGSHGSKGYCNITIPKDLLKGPWTYTMDGETPSVIDISEGENATHSFIYFTYIHASTFRITIQGAWVVPEFPSTIILPLLMLTTLIATVLLKKKRKTKPQLP